MDEVGQPVGPPRASLSAGAQATQRFYYYNDRPIYLDVDSTRLILASSLSSPEGAVLDGLRPLRVQVASLERLPQMRDHWVVRLGAVPTAAAATAARNQLAGDARFPFVSNTYRTQEGQHVVVPVNRLAIKFKTGVTAAQIDSLSSALAMGILRGPRPDSGFTEYWLSYPRGAEPLEVAATLYHHPLVEWDDPDKVSDHQLWSVPSDPYYSSQYYLEDAAITRNGVHVDDNVEDAWTLTTGSSSVLVAVLDQGVDGSHPDLYCNGAASGYDAFGINQPDDGAYAPLSTDTHGTLVTGIFHSCHNGVGTAGVAPNVIFSSVRIFRAGLPATDAQIAAAINWAGSWVDVLNNSWGGGTWSQDIENAINTAATQGRGGKGAAVVFAAGNDVTLHNGPIVWPATLDNVLTVGALTKTGDLAAYSRTGPSLDIVAFGGLFPQGCNGADIVTTDISGPPGCNDGGPYYNDVNYSNTFCCTSAATPQVSGTVALLYSLESSLTLAQVRDRLLGGANYWGDPILYGRGKLNAYNTLVPRPTVSLSGPATGNPYSYVTVTATAAGGVPPYTYAWTINGSPTCSNQSTCRGRLGAADTWTTFGVTVTEAGPEYRTASASLPVYACPPWGSPSKGVLADGQKPAAMCY